MATDVKLIDESLKFVWAYMLEVGIITNGEWEYYGGGYKRVITDGKSDLTSVMSGEYYAKDILKNKLKAFGIDWYHTKSPQSSMKSEFTDTFHPAREVETLLGTLVLNDGTSYQIGVDHSEQRFSDYVKYLSQLAKDKERVKEILGEVV